MQYVDDVIHGKYKADGRPSSTSLTTIPQFPELKTELLIIQAALYHQCYDWRLWPGDWHLPGSRDAGLPGSEPSGPLTALISQILFCWSVKPKHLLRRSIPDHLSLRWCPDHRSPINKQVVL